MGIDEQLSEKRQKGGTFAGNTHTPYLQDLNEALLSANVQDARRIINRLRVEAEANAAAANNDTSRERQCTPAGFYR